MKKFVVASSWAEMQKLKDPWELLIDPSKHTIFQRFEWNQAAARTFAAREVPLVAFFEDDAGCAIVPCCINIAKRELRLLGETLFDYRAPLFMGDGGALRKAWGMALEIAAQNNLTFSMESLRQGDSSRNHYEWSGFSVSTFTFAPCVHSTEDKWQPHQKLRRNMQRLANAGCHRRKYSGDEASIVRAIYESKSREKHSLFSDTLRRVMLEEMAGTNPEWCEIFTIEHDQDIVAALVTFLDGKWRRFYTTYHDGRAKWAKHSPGLTLIHEVVSETVLTGLDCDFMTGEQDYKKRLATSTVPLFRVRADQEQVRSMADKVDLIISA